MPASIPATVFFWIATPFFVFLKYHRYEILRSEVWLCVAGAAVVAAAMGAIGRRWPAGRPLILAAAITFFLDVQFDEFWRTRYLIGAFATLSLLMWFTRAYALQVLMAVGATMFVSTLLLPVNAQPGSRDVHARQPSGTLPFTLHIILDEHIGIEGLPPDPESDRLAGDLQAFFHRHGFMLFGGAYSRYFSTVRSLSHVFNFSPGVHNPALYEKSDDEFTWDLTRNNHLSTLVRRGYAVRVHQSNHVNVCADTARLITCDTYSYAGISALETAELSSGEKGFVIASIFLTRTAPYVELSKSYVAGRRQLLRHGIWLPVWNGFPRSTGPLVSSRTMDTVRERLASARHGEYVLAHLLLPHSPYVYDSDCSVLPPWRWLERNAPASFPNTDEGRTARYKQYLAQLRCVNRKLDGLLNAIPSHIKRDAIVIIQGDHGSRITTAEPSRSPFGQLTPRDYVDGYSTLFAVRAPGLPAAYDTRLVPVSCLFRTLVQNGYANTAAVDGCAKQPAIFVLDDRGSLNIARLPPFAHN